MISLCGVAVDLGGRRVLTDVTLDALPGELLGLLGPNGAGKTTLLRTILGLVRPATGSITIDGSSARRQRHRIGYVPQRHEVEWDYPVSVEQLAATGRMVHRRRRGRLDVEDHVAVAAALDRVGLTGLADRPIGELSGGQCQRALVARALVGGGDVLLLDEPFTGLDAPTQQHLVALFGELAAAGRTVVMSTHDLANVTSWCDRVALISGGVVAVGRPSQIPASAWSDAFGPGVVERDRRGRHATR